MKVNELVARAPVDEITVKIEEKGEARDVRGGSLHVCDCKASDDTGSVTLTLWNDEINKVDVGDMVTIKKGWVNEFQGNKQLSAGKFGEMSVEKGSGAAPKEEKKEQTPKEVADAIDEDII